MGTNAPGSSSGQRSTGGYGHMLQHPVTCSRRTMTLSPVVAVPILTSPVGPSDSLPARIVRM
jgi:hypothetical protein